MLGVDAVGIVMALFSDGPEDVVVAGVMSVMSVVSPVTAVVSVVSVVSPVVPVVPVMMSVMSMVSSGGPKDVGVTFFSVIIFIFFVVMLVGRDKRVDDVVGIVGDDEHHLSVSEELVEMLGSHLELRDEVDHLLGDVLGGGGQLDDGDVFAFLVAEGRMPEFVDGFVVRLEGCFGVLFIAGQFHIGFGDDLFKVDVLLDEVLHDCVELFRVWIVLCRLSQCDDRLGQGSRVCSDVTWNGRRSQSRGDDGAEDGAE